MGIDHILHAVGNDVTRGQRIEHAVVPHGNAIIDGDGIELSRIAAHLLYFLTDNLSYLMQMGMARHKLGKRIDDGNNRLTKLLVFHTCGYPQGASTSHSAAFSAHGTA